MVNGLDAAKVRRAFKSLLGKDIELVGWAYRGELQDHALGKSYGDDAPIRAEGNAYCGIQQS